MCSVNGIQVQSCMINTFFFSFCHFLSVTVYKVSLGEDQTYRFGAFDEYEPQAKKPTSQPSHYLPCSAH